MTKPFNPRELLARIRARLRRWLGTFLNGKRERRVLVAAGSGD